jgi:glycosyltransferase involved in cell wall biosynthesis
MSKNVLYIGPYRQSQDGWCIAARSYIQSLIKTGVNLTIRPVYMGVGTSEPPPEFLEYEENILPHYDVVIQHVLPHLLDYNGDFGKNIAIVFTESSNWQNTWASRLNRMHEIWVPSQSDVMNLTRSKVTSSIKKVPIPLDCNKFTKSYESERLKELKERETFKFYFIGEFIQRKSIDKLLQAFHIEFDSLEPVDLVIKTNKSGLNGDQVAKQLNDYINRVKNMLRIYSDIHIYKQEICITDKLLEDELYYLHNACNCFIMPSMGESWSMPTIDALGFGKTPIVIKDTGPNDVVNPTNGWVVPSYLDHVLVLDPPIQDLYTGREIWHNYSIKNLCETMRLAYEYKKIDKTDKGIEDVYQYSYSNITELMKNII